jgi:hypothetical protein
VDAGGFDAATRQRDLKFVGNYCHMLKWKMEKPREMDISHGAYYVVVVRDHGV